jgi:hypothetical protein
MESGSSNPQKKDQKSDQQKIDEGYGAKYHRRYGVSFEASMDSAIKAMRDLQADPNHFSPQLLARFEKLSGATRELRNGDEFHIHITGPWSGPVRVEGVTPEAFRLVTLKGHLESGEINFKIKKINESESEFEIESLARSRDAVVDFVYDKIPLVKAAQTEMWSAFCKSFAEHVHALNADCETKIGEVKITTERQDEETGQWEKL